jgi:protein-tyrosine phosphatase
VFEQQILFVCMGNICRSPTAHGVMRQLLRQAGLHDRVQVSSAGTHGYHLGSPPDPRSVAAAARRGLDLSDLRASAVSVERVRQADWVLVMDAQNLRDLHQLAPPALHPRIRLLTDFATVDHAHQVADPYYGESDGFEQVLDLVQNACEGLLAQVRQQLGVR